MTHASHDRISEIPETKLVVHANSISVISIHNQPGIKVALAKIAREPETASGSDRETKFRAWTERETRRVHGTGATRTRFD